MVYLAIQEIYDEQGHSISELCRFAEISRSAYYKWRTDVTEMKYGANGKAYLSAILDLADKSLVLITDQWKRSWVC